MAAIFTTAGLAAMQAAYASGTAVIINRIAIGTLLPAQRYDALAGQTSLVDPSPVDLTAHNWNLAGSGPTVQYQISIDTPPALTGSEMGFFSGSTLIVLIANQSGDLFTKAQDANALFAFGFTWVNGTPTAITFTFSPYAIATNAQMVATTPANNLLVSPAGVRHAINNLPLPGGNLADGSVDSDAIADRAVKCYHLDGVVNADTKVVKRNWSGAITASLNAPRILGTDSGSDAGLDVHNSFAANYQPVLCIENIPAGPRDTANPPGEECVIIRNIMGGLRLHADVADVADAWAPGDRIYLKEGWSTQYPFTRDQTPLPVGYVRWRPSSGPWGRYSVYLDLWGHLIFPQPQRKMFTFAGRAANWSSGSLGFRPREVEVRQVNSGNGLTSHGSAVKDDAGTVVQRCVYRDSTETSTRLSGSDISDSYFYFRTTVTTGEAAGVCVRAAGTAVTATLGDDSVTLNNTSPTTNRYQVTIRG